MTKRKDLDTCDGKYCPKKEKCVLYLKFTGLVKQGKFPRSIDSLTCIEPIWQNEEFLSKEYNLYKEDKNIKE